MKSRDFAKSALSHPRFGVQVRNSVRLVVLGVLAVLTASIFPVIGGHNPGPEVTPEIIDGNAECQKPGGQPDLVKPGQTWLEAKDDSPPFESATGPGGFVATITHTGRTVDWTANMAVDGVLTKPGSGQDGRSHFYRYDDPTVSPNDDVQATPNDPGEVEGDDALTWTGSTGLSHVTFCYDLDPNLKVQKSASASSVDSGGDVSFRVDATNAGGAAATGVSVTDDLEDGLTGVAATYDNDPGSPGGTGSCSVESGNKVVCPVGDLAAADADNTGAEPDAAAVFIQAKAPTSDCGDIVNTAQVSGANESDSHLDDNTSNVVTVTVRCSDVSLRKASSSSSVDAGDQVTYTVTATNAGSGKATAVVVKDNLNDKLAGVSATYDRDPNTTGDTGDCDVSQTGNEVTCSIGSLEPTDGNTDGPEPDVAVITIRATAPSEACGTVENVASVSAENEPSANNGNNSSGTVRVAVVCAEPVAQVVEATVSGLKFRDADGDGAAREDEDPALAGWRIYVDYNNNGNHDSAEPFDDTDSNGVYEITGIDSGKFRIREVAQANWTCTFPNPCFYEETLDAGESFSGKNFGNRANVEVAPERFERQQGAPAPPPAAPSDPSGREMAATGAPSLALNLFAALMLIITGIALVLASRRRFGH